MELATAHASIQLDSSEHKSYLVEEKQLYSFLSPRGSPYPSPQPDVDAASEGEGMEVILALLLLITPEH
jgi:hypothetical protein